MLILGSSRLAYSLKMKRFKKYQILLLFIMFALVFFMFQFSFLSNLKSINTDHIMNPKLYEVKKLRVIKQDIFKQKNFVINKTEYLIPLDSSLNPHLIDILPFNQGVDHLFKFNKIFINESNFNSSANNFLRIEHENRLLRSNKQFSENKIRGVNKKYQFYYQPKENNKFKCLNSNQILPYEQLNDNYCDCVDGTDEPGTSACQFGYFYCDFQNKFLFDHKIPSSKVNDKICDCCDGSDESSDHQCKNTCTDLISIRLKENDVRLKGLVEKKKYLAEGIQKSEKLYGPKGIFYRISKFCFEISMSKYTYKVCPYREVLQIDSNKHVNIGHNPQLVRYKSGKWALKMIDGELTNCPQQRSSEIFFECGIKDEIISVQEPQKCVYVFVLSTPAIC